MKNIYYNIIQAIRHNYLSLNENQKNFILYALSHSHIHKNEIYCSFSINEGYYFLCNNKSDPETLNSEMKKFFNIFSISYIDNRRTVLLQLVNRISVDSTKIRVIFDLYQVRMWLTYKEVEIKNSINEFVKEEIDNIINGSDVDDSDDF